ncbi:MAG: hypothetical protein MJ094_05220 [Saccharofermentans sp.]|nr:hypothetical protein [Saccharofermentans sp.]
MKKNIMMRTASGLLIAVMLTSSIISGTLAKYTTSGSSTDSARVAHFGVTVSGAGDTAFATEYNTDNGTPYSYTGTLSVKSSTTDKVIAPGTTGNLAAISVSGTPEVAVAVTYVADFEIGVDADWTVGTGDEAQFYCPIVITVGDHVYYGRDYTSAQQFEEVVESAIESDLSRTYAPLTTISAATQAITWAWPYEANTTYDRQVDEFDTALGNATTPATISLAVTATVTQID